MSSVGYVYLMLSAAKLADYARVVAAKSIVVDEVSEEAVTHLRTLTV